LLRVRFHFRRALSRFEHIAANDSNVQILILLVPSGFVRVFGWLSLVQILFVQFCLELLGFLVVNFRFWTGFVRIELPMGFFFGLFLLSIF